MAHIETYKGYAVPADADADGEGEWGVYETECPDCGKRIVQVALVVDVEAGYLAPEDERCFTCMNMPELN